MATFVSYLPDTGKIVAWGTCPDHTLADQAIRGSVVLEIALDPPEAPWGETHMVLDGELVERPQLSFDKTTIIANGIDAATLANLPDPCTVLVDGDPHEIAGGRIEMVTTMPGVYVIEIEDPFPAKPFRAEVIAHAP